LRETKFAKFPGGACPQTPLQARAVGARLSAFGAKRASLFLLKRSWNVCLYNTLLSSITRVDGRPTQKNHTELQQLRVVVLLHTLAYFTYSSLIQHEQV